MHAADGSVLHDPLLSGLGNRILPIGIGRGGAWGTDLYTVNQHTGALIRADLSGQITVMGTDSRWILGDFEFGPDEALYYSDPRTRPRLAHCLRRGPPRSPRKTDRDPFRWSSVSRTRIRCGRPPR